MKTRKLTYTLVLTLLLALIVGCASDNPAASTDASGTLILSVNPSIAVKYNEDGTVKAVNAVNKDGQEILEGYTGFEGKETKTVVAELIQRIGNAGFLVDDIETENRAITIEIESGSHIPNEQFLQEIARTIKVYLDDTKLSNPIRLPRENDSNYDDLTDYQDTDYDGVDTDFDDTDYDGIDTDYDDTDFDGVDTDYDDTDFDGVDTDYDDTDYDGVDTDYDSDSDYNAPAPAPAPAPNTDYDDSGYDDSGYDDSGYDDSVYDDSGYDD